MTKRTQRFVFLGVAILVLGLGTGLVASYVGLPNLGIVGSDGPVEGPSPGESWESCATLMTRVPPGPTTCGCRGPLPSARGGPTGDTTVGEVV